MGVRYHGIFTDSRNSSGTFRTYRVLFDFTGYAGSSSEVRMGSRAMVIDQVGSKEDLVGVVELRADFEITNGAAAVSSETFFTENEKSIRCTVQRMDPAGPFAPGSGTVLETIFVGYVTPRQSEDPYHDGAKTIRISATDGIAYLKNEKFITDGGYVLEGINTWLFVFKAVLDKIGLTLPFTTVGSLRRTGQDASGAFEPMAFTNHSLARYASMTYYEVLQIVATHWNARIVQHSGEWWMLRLYDLPEIVHYRKWAANGTYISGGTYDNNQTAEHNGPLQPLSGGVMSYDLSVKKLVGTLELGGYRNKLQNAKFQNMTGADISNWSETHSPTVTRIGTGTALDPYKAKLAGNHAAFIDAPFIWQTVALGTGDEAIKNRVRFRVRAEINDVKSVALRVNLVVAGFDFPLVYSLNDEGKWVRGQNEAIVYDHLDSNGKSKKSPLTVEVLSDKISEIPDIIYRGTVIKQEDWGAVSLEVRLMEGIGEATTLWGGSADYWVQYYDVSLEIVNEALNMNTTEVKYTLTNDAASMKDDKLDLHFADMPDADQDSAMLDASEAITTANWITTGDTTEREIVEHLMRERLAIYSKPPRFFDGDIWGHVHPLRGVELAGEDGIFVPLQVKYDYAAARATGRWIRLRQPNDAGGMTMAKSVKLRDGSEQPVTGVELPSTPDKTKLNDLIPDIWDFVNRIQFQKGLVLKKTTDIDEDDINYLKWESATTTDVEDYINPTAVGFELKTKDHHAAVFDVSALTAAANIKLPNVSTSAVMATDETAWMLGGNITSAIKKLGSKTNYNWQLIHNDNTIATVGATGLGIGTDTPLAKIHTLVTAADSLSEGTNSARLYSSAASTGTPGVLGASMIFGQRWLNSSTALIRTGGIAGLKTAADGSFGGGLALLYQSAANVALSIGAVMRHDGNLGIGVLDPTYKLDVAGTGHFSGDVTFDTAPSSLQDATSANHLVRYSQFVAASYLKPYNAVVKTVSFSSLTKSGLYAINGYTPVADELVLDAYGDAGSGVWKVAAGAWSRPTDANEDTELRGFIVSIQQGTYAGYKYQNTNTSAITINTTPVTYTEWSNTVETDPAFTAWRDATRTARTVWAAPAGSNGAASWRALSIALGSEVTGVLPVASGGTGSATQNFVDLTTDQTSIDGHKGFIYNLLMGGDSLIGTEYYRVGSTEYSMAYINGQHGVYLNPATGRYGVIHSEGTKTYLISQYGGLWLGDSTSYVFPTERLQVDGNVRYSGTLKPANQTPTANMWLKAPTTSTNAWAFITSDDITDHNAANKLLKLNSSGFIDSTYLPAFIDDVLEYANLAAMPATGETGKIYIALDTNRQYRWSGSTYVHITDGSASWGAIGGTLSAQADLQSALNAKLSTTTAASTYQPILPSGSNGQLLGKSSSGLQFLNLEINPLYLGNKKFAVGTEFDNFGEVENLSWENDSQLRIGNYATNAMSLTMGFKPNDTDAVIEYAGFGDLYFKATRDMYFENFTGGGNRMLAVTATGKLYATTIPSGGGGIGSSPLTADYIGFGDTGGVLTGSNNLKWVDGRFIRIQDKTAGNRFLTFGINAGATEAVITSEASGMSPLGLAVYAPSLKIDHLKGGGSTQMLTITDGGIVGRQAIPSGGGGGVGNINDVLAVGTTATDKLLNLNYTSAAARDVISIYASDYYATSIFFKEAGTANYGGKLSFDGGVGAGQPDPTTMRLHMINDSLDKGGIAIYRQHGNVYIGDSHSSFNHDHGSVFLNKLFVDGGTRLGKDAAPGTNNYLTLNGTKFSLYLPSRGSIANNTDYKLRWASADQAFYLVPM